MAKVVAVCLGLLLAAAAADNQKCDNTTNQECDGGAYDHSSLLAHSLVKKQRALAASASMGDTLEACLSAGGGSPFTFMGSQVNENSVKDIHNARVTNSIKPSAVVFAQKESEVVHAVSCAYKFNKPVYGRSGMNQYEASCADEEGSGAGCVLVDTSNLWQLDWASTGCQNGESGCIVALGPGLSLGSMYVQLSKRNYTLPAGTCAQVRVAGQTLGGGKGFLTRKYGLTIDRLRGINAVLLNGTKVYASKDSEPHLFWLARGGGGNIFPGVVIAFHFELVPLPESFLTASKVWQWSNTSPLCRQQVIKNWYEKLALDSDTDLSARLTIQDSGSPTIQIDITYYGSDKQGALDKLDSVRGGCNQGSDIKYRRDNNSWVDFVRGGAPNASEQDLVNNNCGWLLAKDEAGKPTATHTPCFGNDISYEKFWAYRSLIFGKDKFVPDSLFHTLANVDFDMDNFYMEFDPTNGAAAMVPSDATAFPWRDPGYVLMQKVQRAVSRDEIQAKIDSSAEFMRELTADVPIKGYYNYLDKNMSSYGGVPRDTYYGQNADRVEEYLREYTEGISPNGCARCDSWELRSP